ncbi:MAG: winged helix-turn-helix domain-containing protein [Bifidobacterium aquikefiri]|uniref:ArsR family transcriptional regulator n=1 Tax=Bifidobacterium aquikefiri TaxID=1653207 RepID=A0A261G1T8_9BIFI|nr:winged helix-turn-helix domain-containing protein [Bifidobacterium aquikefiri]OZG65133.1 ArsR family transcriptional regulator [Bifidobacterium aquikefiri]
MCTFDTGSDIARLASTLADPTRANVCATLMDGCAWTASELARQTRVSPQAMTSCLSKLEESHLITRMRQGRHRYVRLCDEHTAQIIEFMGIVAETTQTRVIGYRQVRADRRLRYARTCYNHIAGHLAILITTAMQTRGLIDLRDDSIRLTDKGTLWFANNGMPESQLRKTPRIKGCLDWTERRMHIGGSAGSALCSRLMDLSVIRRNTPRRALRVTTTGKRWFVSQLGIDEDTLDES